MTLTPMAKWIGGFSILYLITAVLTIIFLPAPVNVEQTSIRVSLGWLHQAQYAGMYVAEEKGLYDAAGLDVDLQPFSFERDQIQELSRGDIDVAVVATTEVISALDQGHDFLAVGAVYQINPYAFASLASSEIESPVDFVGKRLGDKGGNAEAILTYNALLNQFSIPADSVTSVLLDFSMLEWEDLVNDRADVVDLFRTDQTYLFEQNGIEFNLIQPEDYGFGTYADLLMVRRSFAEDHPEELAQFVQATMHGWEYTLDHQEETIDIVMSYTEGEYDDRTYQEHILSESIPLIRPQENRPLGEMNFLPWNRAYQQMIASGVVSANLDITEAYTNDFLE